MKAALVLIDCLRYDASDVFEFSGLQKLTKVASVSNWTLPVLTTWLTGLHPLEHGAGVMRHDPNSTEINAMVEWPSRLVGYDGWLLTDTPGAYALVEIPILPLIKGRYQGQHCRADKGGLAHERVPEHLDASFLLVHLKGGHSDWRHSPDDWPQFKRYHHELDILSEELEPVVQMLIDTFDVVVVASDHGRFFGKPGVDYHVTNHGADFGLPVLHIPVWHNVPDIADELYDGRVVFELLTGRPPTRRQVAFASNAGHMTYNRIAMTYTVGGALRCDVVETLEGWDLWASP